MPDWYRLTFDENGITYVTGYYFRSAEVAWATADQLDEVYPDRSYWVRLLAGPKKEN